MPMPFLDALKEPIAAFHRHPAMSSSNPFRRKETQILGLDNSSFIVASTDFASAVGRAPETDSASIKAKRQYSAPVQSLRPETLGDATNSNTYHPVLAQGADRGEYTRSQYNHQSPVQTDSPFAEEFEDDEDEFDDDLDDAYPSHRKGRRLVPYKANQALNVDWDSPWRNSTGLGNQPGTSKHSERDGTVIPPKAQRTLGMSRTGRALDEEAYRREHSLSPETDNVAPKALRTLGIPSNPFRRPTTSDGESLHGDEGDRFSIASAVHRQVDPEEFRRLLLSGQRAGPFDNSSSTDVSSNSRSSVLSSQSYRETPRSSHEILPDDLNSRAYNRLAHRTPLSFVSSSTKSRTDSLADSAAVLTEPFSPLSLHPDSPTDLNKPLPSAPRRTPETIFELPAHLPGAYYGPSNKSFVAELPASEPIAELPSDTVGIVELPSNEILQSPTPSSNTSKTGPMPLQQRRTGLTRAATSDYPNVAELESPGVAELPDRELKTKLLHHAKTIPSMHTVSQVSPQQPPVRGSSLPKRVQRTATGSLPPDSTPSRSVRLDYQPVLSSILPHYTSESSSQQKPSAKTVPSSIEPDLKSPVRSQDPSSSEKEVVVSNSTQLPAPAGIVQPVQSSLSSETLQTSTGSPLSSHTNTNRAETTPTVQFNATPRKGSCSSLKSLGVPTAMAEVKVKASSTSLGDKDSNMDIVTDISALRRDVDSLRHKIHLPEEIIMTASAAGQGTPPEAVETGNLGKNADGSKENKKSSIDGGCDTSEIQRAVQNAADEAARKTPEGSSDSSTTGHLEDASRSSSSSGSEDITPRASDVEGTAAFRDITL